MNCEEYQATDMTLEGAIKRKILLFFCLRRSPLLLFFFFSPAIFIVIVEQICCGRQKHPVTKSISINHGLIHHIITG